MKKQRTKTPLGRMMRMLLWLLLLGVCCFLAALGALTWAEKSVPQPEGSYDAIIVLGAQVKEDGTPSNQLRLRLEKALEYYQQSPTPIIACGAQGANEPAPEGDVMKSWLLERGVPEEHIVSETSSFNTKQNIRNAKALLPEGARRVILVTSDYHLPRAMQLARDEGLDAGGLGSPIQPLWWLKNHGREVLAWCKYFVEKAIPLDM